MSVDQNRIYIYKKYCLQLVITNMTIVRKLDCVWARRRHAYCKELNLNYLLHERK